MKLIIDIPDEMYDCIKKDTESEMYIIDVIKRGIPYEERPQGEWEYTQYDGNPNIGNWHCSECRHIVPGMYISKPEDNFCSFCGADMRGGEK